MGPLAQIYSAGDTLKRQFRGLLDEPLGTLQQFVNHMNDRSRSLNELTTASANEFRQTKRSGGPQTEKLAGVLADAYNPIGMTVKGPQSQALETARQNAVKMLGLPENNTPMDRAKALGFEDGWAHGSPNPSIKEMLPSGTGAEGPGVYATNYLPEASTYSFTKEGSTVYPLMVKKSKTLNADSNVYEMLGASSDEELLKKLKLAGKDSIKARQAETPQWLIDAGAPYMPARDHYVSASPPNFRSRFAAFDPARVNENDLLGRADPYLLGLLGAGAGGAAYLSQDR